MKNQIVLFRINPASDLWVFSPKQPRIKFVCKKKKNFFPVIKAKQGNYRKEKNRSKKRLSYQPDVSLSRFFLFLYLMVNYTCCFQTFSILKFHEYLCIEYFNNNSWSVLVKGRKLPLRRVSESKDLSYGVITIVIILYLILGTCWKSRFQVSHHKNR